MKRSYDLVVVGGGSAGFNAARIAAGLGRSVAVIDGARKLGGLCILRGCMPSKTLIYSAEVLHLAREGPSFGLRVAGARANMAALHARKKRIIAEFARDRVKQLKAGQFDLIRGHARFLDAHTVGLEDGRKVRGSHFLIGTGSKVSTPPIQGLADSPHWTSDDILELDFKPRSIIVLGGGIVACELAQFLNRIGTQVCIIQRGPALIKNNSKEAAEVVAQAFRDERIEVLTHTEVTEIRSGGAGIKVTFQQGGKTHRRKAAHLLNAMGREPATAGLGLEVAGVKTKPDGRILTNRWQQTSVPHIYAAGDCCGPHEIVHVAIQQAELAARHVCRLKHLKPITDALLLGVIFTDPQVASIGWHEKNLKERGVHYISASHPFNDHGKSMLMNANYGYVKIFADAHSGRILGAEMVGKDAGELIHCFSTALALRATVFDMLQGPWYHPTLSEIVTYPLEEIAEKLPGARKLTAARSLRH